MIIQFHANERITNRYGIDYDTGQHFMTNKFYSKTSNTSFHKFKNVEKLRYK